MESYVEQYDMEKKREYISIFLIISVVALCFSYFYFIYLSVLNTVARQQDDAQIAQMTSKISGLENSYMAKKSDINIEMAYSLGFQDDFDKVHFSNEKTITSGNLSLVGNEH